MTKQIPLSGQNGEGKFAIVDDEDYAAVSVYSWHCSCGYAITKNSKRNLRLHHLIFGSLSSGFVVDHIDGNRLNNQRANLRLVTATQNAQNIAPRKNTSSRFKGVCWAKSKRFWKAEIQFEKTRISLGYFASEIDAARAYNAAAVQYHGEYARLNIIPDDVEDAVRYRQAIPLVHSRTSKYRGVHLHTGTKRWVAQIRAKRKAIHLGCFDTEEEAAKAFDVAAKLHHGDRAFLNFPDFEME